jgi:hypothetical protein
MRLTDSKRVFYATIVTASVALFSSPASSSSALAARSFGQPTPSLQALATVRASKRPSSLGDSGKRSTGDVIVSAGQGVYVYSTTLAPIAQILNVPGRPAGLALDAAGDLYIANGGSSGIPVYKNDYKTLLRTLIDPNPSQGIAVAQNGVIGVIGAYPPSVAFYASGSTSPCASLSLPSVHGLFQGAFDSANNFYITGQSTSYDAIVGVIRGGCSATQLTVLTTGNSLGEYVYGIQITRYGKIAIEDQDDHAIYTYNPPIKGALGNPIAVTVLSVSTNSIYQFGFTAEGAFLFTPMTSGIVSKFAYPAGGNAIQSFGKSQELSSPTGLVVAPPAQP